MHGWRRTSHPLWVASHLQQDTVRTRRPSIGDGSFWTGPPVLVRVRTALVRTKVPDEADQCARNLVRTRRGPLPAFVRVRAPPSVGDGPFARILGDRKNVAFRRAATAPLPVTARPVQQRRILQVAYRRRLRLVLMRKIAKQHRHIFRKLERIKDMVLA